MVRELLVVSEPVLGWGMLSLAVLKLGAVFSERGREGGSVW